MDLFCRGCLKTVDDLADLLQYTEESRRLFIYSTGLQVKRNDIFPFQLCKECYYSMKTLCKFKKICRTSDKQIKSFLALKDVDEGLDFSTFLKRHEESLTFRLPMLSEDNVSAKQKVKDDDNESTCTSIQNFMTDLLRAEEIPDSEASIIREVIEEEADVLEDSLDSHWLQDDNSMESDFELNFSLKQFLSTHSTNNDQLYSSDYREVTSNDMTSGEDYENIQIDNTFEEMSDPVNSNYVPENDTVPIESTLQECTDPVDSSYVIEHSITPIQSTLQQCTDPVNSSYVIENSNIPIQSTLQQCTDPVDGSYVIENTNIPIQSTLQHCTNPVDGSYVIENSTISIQSTLQKCTDPVESSYVIENSSIPIQSTLQDCPDPLHSINVLENGTITIESTLQKCTDPMETTYVVGNDPIPIQDTTQQHSDQVDSTYIEESDYIPVENTLQKVISPGDTSYIIGDDNTPIKNTLNTASDPAESTYLIQDVCDIDIENNANNSSCAIDINLEKALMDENNQEIPLEEILASPSAFITTSNLPPIKTQTLLGEKVHINNKKSPNFDTDLDLLMGKLNNVNSDGGELLEANLDSLTMDKDEENEALIKSNKKKSKFNSTKNVGKLGKFCVDKSQKGMSKKDHFIIEELLDSKTSLDNLNVAKLRDEELDLEVFDVGKTLKRNLDIKVLNMGKTQGSQSNTANISNWFDNKLDYKTINTQISQTEKLEIKDDGDIDQEGNNLEEFLIVNKEELEDIIKQEEDCEGQMECDEVTEVTKDNRDDNVKSNKNKKFLHDKLSEKNLFSRESKSPSIEKKYCITNFYCKMCSKKFKNLAALKVHFARFHQYQIVIPKTPRPVNIKICEICSRSFTNTKSLLRHLASHKNPQEYSCERCALTFRTEHALNTHNSIHMKTTIKPKDSNSRYVCKICGAISTSSSNHLTHQRRHSKSYTLHCDECGRGFYRTTELEIHMRLHTGEKPFTCLYCDRCFSRRDCLNRHMKCHTEEKPFDCQYCGRTFAKRYDIKVHQSYNKYCLKIRQKLLVQSNEV